MDPLSKKSGPNNPHGGVRAEVTVKSGPNNPHGGVAVTSGPNNPHGGSVAGPQGDATAGAGTATAEATEPEAETREDTVSIRLSIPHPEPFSVFVRSDDKGGVQIDSIEIRICKADEPVFTALLDADLPVMLRQPAESHVFPLSEEQLTRAMHHFKAGETVEVRVHYIAPDNSQVGIGIIGREHHHTLGRFIEHLFHRS